jgi:hypothetical protein
LALLSVAAFTAFARAWSLLPPAGQPFNTVVSRPGYELRRCFRSWTRHGACLVRSHHGCRGGQGGSGSPLGFLSVRCAACERFGDAGWLFRLEPGVSDHVQTV